MKKLNQLRIIAGKWRGRKINFATEAQIRPTKDSVRETLFNWLSFDLEGARCLDLFAGSGALGFEALSRGAAFVAFVDQSWAVINKLKENAQTLNILPSEIAFYCAKAIDVILSDIPFDIVFLDPPFEKNLIAPTIEKLVNEKLVKKNTLIYIEVEKNLKTLPIPSRWQILKSKISGQVGYYLVRVV